MYVDIYKIRYLNTETEVNQMYLTQAERYVMELLWQNGEMAAREIVRVLERTVNWRKTTGYTMISRCEEKGYLSRRDPGYLCSARVSKQQVTKADTDRLLEQGYDGSADLLVASLVNQKKLSLEQMEALCRSLRQLEEEE